MRDVDDDARVRRETSTRAGERGAMTASSSAMAHVNSGLLMLAHGGGRTLRMGGRPTAGDGDGDDDDDDDEGGDGGVRRIDHGEERVGRGVFLVVLVLVVVGVDEQTRGLAAAAHSRRRADAAEKRERGVRKRGGERIGGHERDGIRDS